MPAEGKEVGHSHYFAQPTQQFLDGVCEQWDHLDTSYLLNKRLLVVEIQHRTWEKT